ncbi:hypothetical protein HanOQP8_Chr16g0639571 [Helianthus annuus]|nr:hypothetical protein HanHA89_Chr16g0684871 [Helianthus annuus]KAJ0642971.1 hypothetical protein HanLR1_Chr16g0644261 [Helianthus annuus]KAJ0646835.1 hypothetical protein HanOQP8_Chr16g0639571 [Helianthus annuus]
MSLFGTHTSFHSPLSKKTEEENREKGRRQSEIRKSPSTGDGGCPMRSRVIALAVNRRNPSGV